MDLVGARVSHYVVKDVLGHGGMGVVYQARDTRLQRDVALKFLARERSDRALDVERFRREARAASALNHPNICTVHDVGEHEGTPYIAMELMEGRTLRARLRAGPLSLQQAVQVAIDVSEALDAAHSRGIVHRDVKPSNVFLTTRGTSKVLDFGVAKTLREATLDSGVTTESGMIDVSHSGVVVGTVPYMSPEQARGDELDGRSDLFSLGAVLYEAITAERAFPGSSAAIVFDAVLHSNPPPASAHRTEVTPQLDRIIGRALEKDRSIRYQSARDLAADLRRLRREPEPPYASRPPRPAVRRRAGSIWVATASVVVALFVALGGQPGRLVASRDAGGPPVVAVVPPSTRGLDPAMTDVGLGISELLVSSLSRTPAVNVLSTGATLQYGPASDRLERITSELGADYVVDGSLTYLDPTARLSVSLVRAGDGIVEWSGTYEGTLDELLSMQRRAAAELAQALSPGTRLERPSGSPTQPGVEALGRYSRARTMIERPDVPGNLERSVEILSALISEEPRLVLAHAALGQAYWQLYQKTRDAEWIPRAEDAIRRALELDPLQPYVRYGLALVYNGTGRPEEALAELRQAIAMQESDDDAQRLLGIVLSRIGRPEDALAHLQKAVGLRPNYWGNHQALGLEHFERGRYASAAAEFERVTELQPDLAWGYQMLGTVLHVEGDTKRALVNYRKAIELGPDARAYSNLGALLYAERRFEEALRAFQRAADLEPRSPAKHRNLGDTYAVLGRERAARAAYAEAVRLCEDELRVNPRSAITMAMLAVLQAKLGESAEALRSASAAAALEPRRAGVRYREAVAYALTGDSNAALEALEQALALGFGASVARDDEDLSTLRELPRFRTLVGAAVEESNDWRGNRDEDDS